MQIPVEWYTHLLPGFILICAFIPVRRVKGWFSGQGKLSEATLGTIVLVVGVGSYVIGFTENAFLRTAGAPLRTVWSQCIGDTTKPADFPMMRRVQFDNVASPELVKQSWDGYNAMVFQRSLTASCAVFLLAMAFRKALRAFLPKGWRLVILWVGLLAGEVGLCVQWDMQRKSHIEFMNKIASIPWETMSKEK